MGQSILIIDDDSAVRETVKLILGSVEYACVAVSNTHGMVEMVEGSGFDLVPSNISRAVDAALSKPLQLDTLAAAAQALPDRGALP